MREKIELKINRLVVISSQREWRKKIISKSSIFIFHQKNRRNGCVNRNVCDLIILIENSQYSGGYMSTWKIKLNYADNFKKVILEDFDFFGRFLISLK